MYEPILSRYYSGRNMPAGLYYLLRVNGIQRWVHEGEFKRMIGQGV